MMELKELTEATTASKSGKTWYLTGKFASAETLNRNSRIYPKPILEREVKKYQKLIENRQALGLLEHPSDNSGLLSQSAILIESLRWQGNDLIGKCRVLSTPSGKIVQQLLQDGVSLGISSRGQGNICKENRVCEDYKLLGFDLVVGASNYGSEKLKAIKESIQKHTKKQSKEQIIEKTLLEKINNLIISNL